MKPFVSAGTCPHGGARPAVRLRTGLAIAPVCIVLVPAGPAGPPWHPLAALILLGVALWLVGLFAMQHTLAKDVEATVRVPLLQFSGR